MKRKVATLLLASLVIVLTSTALDDDAARELNRIPLKGLTGLHVIVAEIPERPDLNRTIQTVVELELRKAGIKVLSEKEWLAALGRPLLHVNCGLGKTVGVYSIRIELMECVYLVRNGALVVATTWILGSVGYCLPAQADETLEDATSDMLRKFLNDYLAANPRPQVEPQAPE